MTKARGHSARGPSPRPHPSADPKDRALSTTALERRLDLKDAVVIGLSSMVGGGVFVSLGAAADIAGPLTLAAVMVAAVVALGNATSTAQLAAQYPSSGGTYVYGRRQLGPWWGFLAGWCFVIGKTASAAAMALVVAAYLVPAAFELPAAVALVVLMTAVNLVGITRTTRLATILVSIALLALAATTGRLLWAVAASGEWSLAGGPGGLLGAAVGRVGGEPGSLTVVLTVAQAAAIMFFAFAGYARVATLGEEVRDPRRTIPAAILWALGLVFVLYLVLGAVLLLVGPPATDDGLWGPAPFLTALRGVGAGAGWQLIITIGAAAASAGALLSLVAGISRTALSMAREGDLPRALAAVDAKHSVPRRAQIVIGVAVIIMVLVANQPLFAIAGSSFGVLLYYAVANLAAWTQTGEYRRYPRVLQAVGLVGCVLLVLSLPPVTVLSGVVLIVAGVLVRALMLRAG